MDYLESITGRSGQNAAIILANSTYSIWSPLTNNCWMILFPIPCKFTNNGKIYSGNAISALAVESESSWDIVNQQSGIISTSEGAEKSAVALQLLSGVGVVILKNLGQISAKPNNGTAIRVYEREPYYESIPMGFRWANAGLIEGRVAFDVGSKGRFKLTNTGNIYGDILVLDDQDRDFVHLEGNARFIGNLLGVEELSINSAGTPEKKTPDNEIHWSGSVELSSFHPRPSVNVSAETALVTSGINMINGDLVFGEDVKLKIEVNDNHIADASVPVIRSSGWVDFKGHAHFYLDLGNVDIPEKKEIQIIAVKEMNLEILNISFYNDERFKVDIVRLTGSTLVVSVQKKQPAHDEI
ncbi:hypothetical protein [Parendozoicomonas sp. Alg238-R29]|uniref:hypothetical protein n=1 Tax=Parendozoicomonas sp. Alg238-R29 TaxID=2993446 RepID=UPI00248F30F7|nr:hypothetical protein [Parendozoicomonas sp. Alg238-R29]